MKMKYLIYFAFLYTGFILVSCSAEHFYEEVDLSDVDYESILTAQVIYYLGDTTFSVWGARTLPPGDRSTIFIQPGSYSFKLMDSNDQVILEGNCNNCEEIKVPIDPQLIRAGDTYSIIFTDLFNNDQISAQTRASLPADIEVIEVDYLPSSSEVSYDFRINDIADQNDFYYIDNIITVVDGEYQFNTFYPDEHLESYFEYTLDYERILPDYGFENEDFIVSGREWVFGFQDQIDTIGIMVVSENWSRELYDYGKSLYIAEEAEFNPFIEPISVRGNFDNSGLGIFALISRDTAQFIRTL